MYLLALNDCINLNEKSESRVGDVYDLGPACFELDANNSNIITLNTRAINPFFAIAEAAWFIGGLNTLDTLSYYLKNYNIFSDDGLTLNGAYGHRLKSDFGYDQINFAVEELKRSPESRRCVLSIYSPSDLRNIDSKDIPCNISVMFKIRNSKLDMTIINRSNDVFLGLPHNFLVFQALHCYVAKEIEIALGYQRHFSDSLHLYEKDKDAVKDIIKNNDTNSPPISNIDNVDLIKSILDNCNSINERRYQDITDNQLRSLFMAYNDFKIKKDVTLFDNLDICPELRFLIDDWLLKYY